MEYYKSSYPCYVRQMDLGELASGQRAWKEAPAVSLAYYSETLSVAYHSANCSNYEPKLLTLLQSGSQVVKPAKLLGQLLSRTRHSRKECKERGARVRGKRRTLLAVENK
jgi:hypothetical protein